MAARSSAAIPIIRPTSTTPSRAGSAVNSPAKRSADLPSSQDTSSTSSNNGDAAPAATIIPTNKLCKNIGIYGHCKFEGKGCAYSHDIDGATKRSILSTSLGNHTPTQTPTSSRPSTPSFIPRSAQTGSETPVTTSSVTPTAALFANAKSFVPKVANTPTSSGSLSAASSAFTPSGSGNANVNVPQVRVPEAANTDGDAQDGYVEEPEDLFDDTNPYATPSSHSAQLATDDYAVAAQDYAYDASQSVLSGNGDVVPTASGGYYGSDGVFHSNLMMGMSGIGLGGIPGIGMGMSLGPDGRAHLHQPLQYHLYQPALPHILSPSSSSLPSSSSSSVNANPHSAILQHFFMSPTLRSDLITRQSVLSTHVPLQKFPFDQPDLPASERVLGNYWGFITLDKKYPPEQVRVDSATGRVVGGSVSAGIYGYRTWCWRCMDEDAGKQYVARRVEGFRLSNETAIASVEKWSRLKHPNIVGIKEAFTSRAFRDNSLVFIYDYHPLSSTLLEVHLTAQARGAPPPAPIPERVLWSYMVQIAGALKAVHSSGMAVRCLDPSKILLTGQNRVRINCISIFDVISPYAPSTLPQYQADDLLSLGKLFLSLATHSLTAIHNIPQSMDILQRRNYSQEFSNAVLYLLSKPNHGNGGGRKGIDEFLGIVAGRMSDELAGAFDQSDLLENELQRELENARLVRLMAKFGFINERPEYDHDPRWAETGDRYLIKLFRDYLYHQIDEHGRPVIDLSHVLTCLNKLDAGVEEQLALVSRDEQSCLIVSYREVKTCLENSFRELAR